MSTTVRLPDDLKARVAEKAAWERRRADFDAEAEARYAAIVASGGTISWQEMRGYLEARIVGTTTVRLPRASANSR